MDTHLLEEIGLTKGETIVYLTLLKTGETTTGKIIEEAQISAGKIYQILDKLIKKGLAGYIIKEKTKYFSATHPNRILDLMHEKEKNLKEKEDKVKELLPSLIQSYTMKRKKHETTLFMGFNGIKTAVFEVLNNMKPEDEVLAMGITTSREKKFNIMWENWHRQREKKKIKCKCMFSEISREYLDFLKKLKHVEIKIIKGITPSAVTIVKDILLIHTFHEEPSCLVIKNKYVALSFKSFFNSLWENARINN